MRLCGLILRLFILKLVFHSLNNVGTVILVDGAIEALELGNLFFVFPDKLLTEHVWELSRATLRHDGIKIAI